MFKKLKNTFTFNDYRILNNQVRYGKVRDGVFYGISYDLIPFASNLKLFKVIPEEYRNKFALLSMEINGHVKPHTDNGILTTINFYINAQNAITKFYKFKSDNITTLSLENQNDKGAFELDKLEEYGSFMAKDDEAFILDVTNPHAVICTRLETRRALVLQTDQFSYDEVCKMLEETNNL
jgi:hypothetical protein